MVCINLQGIQADSHSLTGLLYRQWQQLHLQELVTMPDRGQPADSDHIHTLNDAYHPDSPIDVMVGELASSRFTISSVVRCIHNAKFDQFRTPNLSLVDPRSMYRGCSHCISR